MKEPTELRGPPQYWFPDEKNSNEGYLKIDYQHETFYLRAKKEIRNESKNKRTVRKEEPAKANIGNRPSTQREES